MNSFGQLSKTFEESLSSVGTGVVDFIPTLILAVLVIIIGWIVAAAVSKVVQQIFKAVKVDNALSSAGVDDLVRKAGFHLNSGKFLGEIVKWFVIVVTLVMAFDILGLTQINEFLVNVAVGFLPQLISAVLILLIAVLIGDAMKKVVIASAKAAGMKAASFLGEITKWAIWIFAILIALIQVNIAPAIISILFQGIVIALALALGLSFGLGGQQAASDFIQKMKEEIKDKTSFI